LEQTWLFALRPGAKSGDPAQVTAFKIPVKAEELQDQIEQFRSECAQPGGAYKALGQKLYTQLLAPAEKLLAGKTHLVIVPDSAMPPLPFQALVDAQGRHLVERFGVSYAPSVTALTAMVELKDRRAQGEKPSSALLAVGRPQFTNEADLPATEAEVKRIAALAGPKTKVLLGKDATEDRVRSEITNARFVHLATHGKLNEAAPMYSGLALTKGPKDDGVLEARELMDLDLKAEMVVLSACETGLGKQVRGEGVLGLTWALFVAGAPTSVVSQWQVEDTSTGALMAGFYKALLQPAKGVVTPTKGEALRRAQLALMRDGKHGHPYYWAPFVVVGDWR
jgi:CHAT domain-containing protein